MMQSFQMIVLLCTCSVTSGITFEYRIRCPDSPEKWRENSDSYICDGDSVYHCMQNTEGRYVVFCASSIWIQPDYCPEFNSRTSAIDVILCPGDPDSCPETVYLSTAVYQFPSCYRPESSFRTSTPSPTTTWYPSTSIGSHFLELPDENNSSNLLVKVVPVLIGIIVPLTCIGLVVFYVKHREKESKKAALNSEYSLSLQTEAQCSEQAFLLEQKDDGRTESRNSAEDEEKTTSDIENTPERKSSEVSFWKPKDYNMIVDTIKREGVVLLVGKPGSGKTTIANYLANTEFKEYETIFKKPKERIEPKQNTLLLWDDCFDGWNTTNRIDGQVFEALVRLIKQVRDSKKMKAIVCIDSSSVDKNQLNQFKNCVVNVDKCYESQWDKENFRNALNLKILIRKVSTDVGFPLLIHLIKTGFCAGESYSMFLEEPVAYISDDIDGILKEQSDDYITLIYALYNSSAINVKKVNKKLWGNIRKECHRILHKKIDETHPSNNGKITTGRTDDITHEFDQIINNREGNRGQVVFEKDSGQSIKSNDNDTKSKDKPFKKTNASKLLNIDISKNVARYLVESEEALEFRFRHQFLAECVLRYHIEHVGSETILKEGSDEVRMAVEHLHPKTDKPE